MARHLYSCPLRWSDMDAFGHVNNAVFVRYLEEARIDFMFRLAPGEGSESFQGGSVVARHEIDYLRPLVHRHEPVTIETWVTKVGAASLTVAYEVKDADQVYVRASTVVVPFDFDRGRPRRITAEEKMFLEEFRDDAGPAAADAGGQRDTPAKEAVGV
ncbi:acyl-CoA thioesterase [Streptomyces syringium]|uniref:Acyl-CoA thioester hydrolase n=1 Tax=Streptomyces syringium TaxID=76729 RepID=A0ABS4Y2Z6_9ACTN|nr:thioesterase family protein [Streptomyces syringium]MBP2402935.1 acyl-CoA thioester hydrolase [Streptomyces syringium]